MKKVPFGMIVYFHQKKLDIKNIFLYVLIKKKYNGGTFEYNECDEICVLQIQIEEDSFLIEYVVTKEGD